MSGVPFVQADQPIQCQYDLSEMLCSVHTHGFTLDIHISFCASISLVKNAVFYF